MTISSSTDAEAVAKNTDFIRAVFLGSAAFAFLNFALPIHADDLGLSAFAIGGMYTVFTATMLVLRPLVGYALDRFGRRWFFTTAFVFYTAAMSVLALSDSAADFYLARFLQGIGASLMWVTANTMIADLNAAHERGEAMGRLTTQSVRGSMFGAFYGFTLVGMMPMHEAWVWAFAGYAVVAALALLWSLLRVTETRHVAVSDMGEFVWTVPLVRLLVIVFLSGFASALIEPVYLLFLKNKFDVNVLVLAWVFFPAGLVFAILPRYSGAWSDRWGRGRIIALGILLAGCVSAALPFWPALWMIAASYLLFSFGWAMASPAEDALVADLAQPHNRGRTIGAQEAAAGAGAALGPLAGGALYDFFPHYLVFVVNGVVLLIAALLAVVWFLRFTPADARDQSSGS